MLRRLLRLQKILDADFGREGHVAIGRAIVLVTRRLSMLVYASAVAAPRRPLMLRAAYGVNVPLHARLSAYRYYDII